MKGWIGVSLAGLILVCGAGRVEGQTKNMMSATDLPKISVIGNFTATNHEAKIKEIETAFQGYLDPNIRADIFLSLEAPQSSGDGEFELNIEEAFLTFSGYWDGVGMKLGKKRVGFGKENVRHPEQWNMTDLPLAIQYYLGDEGLAYQSGSLDVLLPLPFFCQWEIGAGYNRQIKNIGVKRAILNSRLWASWSWEDRSELETGLSLLSGEWEKGSPGKEGQLYGMDVTYKVWTGPYSKWISQTEVLLSSRTVSGESVNRWGISSFLGMTLDSHWETGLRLECVQHPESELLVSRKATGQMTYRVSETTKSRFSLGYDDNLKEMQVGVQLLFGVGPHSHVLQ